MTTDTAVSMPELIARAPEGNQTALNILNRIYQGEPYTCVEAPPGGGKSHLVQTVTSFLAADAQLSVVVVSPTRKSARMLVERIASQFPLNEDQIALSEANAKGRDRDVAAADKAGEDTSRIIPLSHAQDGRVVRTTLDKNDGFIPEQVAQGVRVAEPGRIVVTTVASMAMRPLACDVMLIDEAFQVTFAQATEATNLARQVILVGDPGQIGPVVTPRVDSFAAARVKPEQPAPLGFNTLQGENYERLPSSYRLGEETVRVIQPLYNFEFHSSRPERHLVLGTEVVPEIDALRLPTASMPDDNRVVEAAVDEAENMLSLVMSEAGQPDRYLTQDDVAIVVSHNSQQAAIAALLNARDLGNITVNTADSLQGNEWDAVVALDPFIGYAGEEPGEHQISSGRLCVMASRHRAHLVFIHDGSWEDCLDAAAESTEEAQRGRLVRENLTASERVL